MLTRLTLLISLAWPQLLSAQTPDLLVTDRDGDRVVKYDLRFGGPPMTFAAVGLDGPVGLTFGPGGCLYVASALNDAVQRYHGTTGAWLGTFATVDDPRQLNFGPDGNLYVASAASNSILRFDGTTGAALGTFASGGGLDGPISFTFGVDGNLYVGSERNDRIKRYDGQTGAFMGDFVTIGLSRPHDLAFGPDGDLYVTTSGYVILRYHGASGAPRGLFVFDFRLSSALGLSWDDQGNLLVVNQGRNEVLRYDGQTGVFHREIVAPGAGGLSAPQFACFAPSDRFASLSAVPGFLGVPIHLPVSGAEPGAMLEFGMGIGWRQRPLGCSGPVRPLMPASVTRVRLVADESGRAGFRFFDPDLGRGPYVTRVGELRTCQVSSYCIQNFY
jgi:sugar lactone lactonase YvrE